MGRNQPRYPSILMSHPERGLSIAKAESRDLHLHRNALQSHPMPKTFCVYIMASRSLNFYVGLTSNLRKRVWQHKIGYFEDSHTSRYRITRLLHYEHIEEFVNAVAREKQLKPWSREKKLRLIRKIKIGRAHV